MLVAPLPPMVLNSGNIYFNYKGNEPYMCCFLTPVLLFNENRLTGHKTYRHNIELCQNIFVQYHQKCYILTYYGKV